MRGHAPIGRENSSICRAEVIEDWPGRFQRPPPPSLVAAYDSLRNFTVIQGDVDGDGAADFEIEVKGDHHDFANFVL